MASITDLRCSRPVNDAGLARMAETSQTFVNISNGTTRGRDARSWILVPFDLAYRRNSPAGRRIATFARKPGPHRRHRGKIGWPAKKLALMEYPRAEKRKCSAISYVSTWHKICSLSERRDLDPRQSIRRRLVASVLTMMTAPLFAAQAHEACTAMHHNCEKIDALGPCCCGARSDSTPPRGSSDPSGAGAASTHSVAVVGATFSLPPAVVMVVHEGPPPLAHPLDLPILFSDLRI
jgi:hypothetical protein